MLSNSPGSIGFEMAPFKLPQDYVDILGGFDSEKFGDFRMLFRRSFRDVRKHAERIITLVELMQKGSSPLHSGSCLVAEVTATADSKLPCFSQGENTSQQLRERFMLSLTQPQVEDFADKLIMNAATSSFTRLYEFVSARLVAALRRLTAFRDAASSKGIRTESYDRKKHQAAIVLDSDACNGERMVWCCIGTSSCSS
jgi:phosphatidylinositol 4-kinase